MPLLLPFLGCGFLLTPSWQCSGGENHPCCREAQGPARIPGPSIASGLSTGVTTSCHHLVAQLGYEQVLLDGGETNTPQGWPQAESPGWDPEKQQGPGG